MPFSKRSRSSRGAFLLVGAIALAVYAPAGGEPAPGAKAEEIVPSGLVEKAEARLNLLEIVVLDSRGRHVKGLPASAFRVRERGNEIRVASLDEVSLVSQGPRTLPGPSPEAPEAVPPASPSEPQTQPATMGAASLAERRRTRPRWFLMLFDGYNNPSALRISELRKAAKRWLSANLREQDFAAVYEMTPYLSSISGFTQDVVELRMAVDEVRVFPAEDIRDELLRKTLTQGSATRSGDEARTMLEEQVVNAARFGGDVLSRERDQFYMNVMGAAEILSELDGTKAVLLFSGGFPLTRTRSTEARGGLTPRFKDMMAALEREGIRVFTFDVGEDGGFTDAETAQNLSQMLDQLEFGQEWLEQLGVGGATNAVNAHQEILAVLGNETGGRFLRGRDYESGLEAAADDLSHYYVLAYEPPPRDPDARAYVPVRVEVEGKGLRAVARRGRFVEESAEAAAAAEEIVRAAEEAAAAKARGEAAPDAKASRSLGIECRPVYFPHPDGRTLVVLPVEITGPVPAVPSAGGAFELDLDLVVSADLSAGDVRTSRRNVRARLKPGAKEALERGIQLREAIVLPAGAAALTVTVRLNGLERDGSWTASVPVPALDPSKFGLVGIAPLAPGHAVPVVFDVFAQGENVSGTVPPSPIADPLGADGRGRPAAYVTAPLAGGTPLIVQLRVAAAPRAEPGGKSPLRLDFELLPEEGGVPLAPPVRYRRIEMRADGALDVVSEIALDSVGPGEWVLRVSAENLVSKEKDVQTLPIAIGPSKAAGASLSGKAPAGS